MSHLQLRRTRGLELELEGRPRPQDRRPWHRKAQRLVAVRTGSFAVTAERLSADTGMVRLAGELDLAAAPALDAALRTMRRWAVRSLLIDVADVGFVDLTIIGRLLDAHRRLEAGGGGLLVVHPPQCLLRVLELFEDLDLPVLR